jgi:DnaJ-class molecular chaperone
MASILTPCGMCNGTGQLWRQGQLGTTCQHCGGDGEVEAGDIAELDAHTTTLADIVDKLNDIKEKVDEIKEVVDAL